MGFPEHITSTLDEGFLSPHTTSWIIFPEWPSGWWNIIILIQCRFTQHTRETSYWTPLNNDGTSDMQGDMFNMFGFQVSVRVWSVTSLGVSAVKDIPIYLLIRLIRCSEGGQTTLWPNMFDRTVEKHQLYTSNKGRFFCFFRTSGWNPASGGPRYQLLQPLNSTPLSRWPGLCGGLCCRLRDGVLHLVAAQLCCAGWTHVPGLLYGSCLGKIFHSKRPEDWEILIEFLGKMWRCVWF